jgi:hypothetical protein
MFEPRGALPAMREGHGTSRLVAFLEDARTQSAVRSLPLR